MVQLFDVSIPENVDSGENGGGANTVYMLKIKIRTEIKVVYVGAPQEIYGGHEQSSTIFSNTQSIRDNIYLEFYDVLEESNFDPTKD
jgi:hypothetical protein